MRARLQRVLTTLRLTGAMFTDSKDVHLYLVEDGARLTASKLDADNLCRALFYELLDVGLDVQVCGSTMKKLGWEEVYPLPGIHRGSMRALNTADEIINF